MRDSPRRPTSSARFRPRRRVSNSRRSRSRSHRSTFRSCTADRRVHRPRRNLFGVSRRPRTLAVIAVAVALVAQTWLWIGVMGAPIGYSFDLRGEAFAYRQFFVAGGALGDLAPASNMSITASSHHFEQDWGLARSEERRVGKECRSR